MSNRRYGAITCGVRCRKYLSRHPELLKPTAKIPKKNPAKRPQSSKAGPVGKGTQRVPSRVP